MTLWFGNMLILILVIKKDSSTDFKDLFFRKYQIFFSIQISKMIVIMIVLQLEVSVLQNDCLTDNSGVP
jgi:hypothetical protein